MTRYLIILTTLVSLQAFSQLKQKIADQHYALLEYSMCVDMYDELAKKCLEDKKNTNWENVRKAAITHFKLFEMDRSAFYFSKLQERNLLSELDREFYIKALRYGENYAKASDLIRESHNLFPQNTFFSTQYEQRDRFDQLFTDSSFYIITDAGINSGEGDFGVSFYENSLVYSSKSKNVGFLNDRYGWDDGYFLNMFHVNINADSSLSEPQLLRENFVSRAHDGPVSFTADGKHMVITKNQIAKIKGNTIRRLALYFSDLNNEGEWSELSPFKFNDPNYDVGHGFLNADGSKLYFVSNKPGGLGGTDIYVSSKVGQNWSEPQNIGKRVNTSSNEMFPFVMNDQLYFSSEGHFGLGGLDLFEISLNGTDVARNIGYPMNTSHDEFNIIVDSTGNYGYFSSNRYDFIDRIYTFKRTPINIALEGDVFAQYKQREPIGAQIVYVKNMTTSDLDSTYTDENGKFSATIRLNQEYRIYTEKDEFILLKEVGLSTEGLKKDSVYHAELILKPTTIQIHLRVAEKKSRKLLPEASVTIRDYEKDWDTTLITNQDGMVTLKVERNVIFWAHGSKRGFIDTDISFNTSNENDKIIDLELALPPIKKGEKFKLENIFYDLNKSTLRPESKSSLDKLAEFIINNDLKIELSAHTDSRGSNSYNQRLSQARAQSCVDYLISKGVRKDRILAKGYGETMLVNKCKDGVQCTEEEHQENRRTEVRILEVN